MLSCHNNEALGHERHTASHMMLFLKAEMIPLHIKMHKRMISPSICNPALASLIAQMSLLLKISLSFIKQEILEMLIVLLILSLKDR